MSSKRPGDIVIIRDHDKGTEVTRRITDTFRTASVTFGGYMVPATDVEISEVIEERRIVNGAAPTSPS